MRSCILLSAVNLPVAGSCFSHRGGIRSGRGGARGRGHGRGRKKPMVKSADDLDKELENYHAEAMNVT